MWRRACAPRSEEHRPPSEDVPKKDDCSAAGRRADAAGRTTARGVRIATHRRHPTGLSAMKAIPPSTRASCGR